MAPRYGASCSVWLDLVDASVFFNDAGLELAIDTAETSTFQPGVSPAWKAFIEGLPEPIYYGMHGGIKKFYRVEPEVEHAATLDHIVGAVGG